MAIHEFPCDGSKHRPSPECPCVPKATTRREHGVVRTVYGHRPGTAAAARSDEKNGGDQ